MNQFEASSFAGAVVVAGAAAGAAVAGAAAAGAAEDATTKTAVKGRRHPS